LLGRKVGPDQHRKVNAGSRWRMPDSPQPAFASCLAIGYDDETLFRGMICKVTHDFCIGGVGFGKKSPLPFSRRGAIL